MMRINKRGFTIIETMLFLAISGALMMALLIGTGASIRNQRYRDSVTYLQSVLQDQYAKVSSVRNDRNNDFTCNESSGVSPAPANGIQPGQSDCIILGRLIVPDDGGKSLKTYSVVAGEPTGNIAVDDFNTLHNYKLMVFSSSEESYDIPWGASMKSEEKNSDRFSILILKSPLSGVIRTFIDLDHAVSSTAMPDYMVTTDNLSNPVTICVDSNGGANIKSAVRVNAGAANASGVETLGEGSGCE